MSNSLDEWHRRQRARQREYLEKRYPGDPIPKDDALLGAFSTSRSDRTYDRLAGQMSDAALRYALHHETIKIGQVKLRREARRRGWASAQVDALSADAK